MMLTMESEVDRTRRIFLLVVEEDCWRENGEGTCVRSEPFFKVADGEDEDLIACPDGDETDGNETDGDETDDTDEVGQEAEHEVGELGERGLSGVDGESAELRGGFLRITAPLWGEFIRRGDKTLKARPSKDREACNLLSNGGIATRCCGCCVGDCDFGWNCICDCDCDCESGECGLIICGPLVKGKFDCSSSFFSLRFSALLSFLSTFLSPFSSSKLRITFPRRIELCGSSASSRTAGHDTQRDSFDSN